MTGWLYDAIPNLQVAGPDDSTLLELCGLRGMLLEGLGKPNEFEVFTTTMASVRHSARLAGAMGGYVCQEAVPTESKGMLASLGVFRYVNIKFSSLAQAKRRALALFLGTWSAPHRRSVPLLTKPMLQDLSVCEETLQLWDVYGLTWPSGDRTAAFQLMRKY